MPTPRKSYEKRNRVEINSTVDHFFLIYLSTNVSTVFETIAVKPIQSFMIARILQRLNEFFHFNKYAVVRKLNYVFSEYLTKFCECLSGTNACSYIDSFERKKKLYSSFSSHRRWLQFTLTDVRCSASICIDLLSTQNTNK